MARTSVFDPVSSILGSADILAVSASPGSSSASELQRICVAALTTCPISFLEGDNVDEFADRLQRFCVLSSGLQPFPLRSLSGLLHSSDNLVHLPAFFIPREFRGLSSAPI